MYSHKCTHTHTYIFLQQILMKRVHKFEREQGGMYEWIWREGENVGIIISKDDKIIIF